MTRLWRVVVLLIALLFPACAVRGLNFQQDKRLTITAPKDRAKVRLPVTIRWTFRDFRVTGADSENRRDSGYFGVYVDRAPQPPGQTQVSLVRDDPSCRRQLRSCESADYLNQADIFAVTTTSFTIDQLPAPPTNAVKRRELHDMTIVFLNGRGDRIGESAYRLQFEVDRSGPL